MMRGLVLLALVSLACHGRGMRTRAAPCPAPRTACPGASGEVVCTPLQTDAANCGACGVSCGQGQVCVAGACEAHCPPPYRLCADGTGKPGCRDIRVDADNCGACGVPCAGGEVCSLGTCSRRCAPPRTLCKSPHTSPAGICANLQNDDLNCGACDRVCPVGLACVEGHCARCNRTTIPGGVMLLDFGAKPTSLEVADVDQDGAMDLVALSPSENTVTVRLGNGDGSFVDRQSYATGTGPRALAIGDFDGDGQPDLAVANAGSGDSVILRGVPDTRGWRQSERLTLPAVPVAMAAADMDQDGLSDLVLVAEGPSSGEILVRLSKKGATFWESFGPPLQGTPTGLVLADLDGDERPDLVVSLQEGSVVVALTGDDGKPGALRRFATGPGCASVLVLDLDGDSRLDLVTGNTGDKSIRVLRGQGDGSFGEARRFDVGAAPAGLFAADINGDGKLDVLTGSPAEHAVRVLFGLGNGALATATLIPAGPSPAEIRVADLNRDGKPDLIAAHSHDKGRPVSVILARDTGVYAPRTQALTDGPFAMRLADLDGDGHRDLVLLGSRLSVLRGTGDGAFVPGTSIDLGSVAPVDLLIADLNQDLRPDVAVATRKAILLYLNDGTARLTAAKTIPVGSHLTSFAVGDINRDGRPDFAARHTNGIDLFMATASGEYETTSVFYSSCGCSYGPSMRLVDLDLDGALDLVSLVDASPSQLEVWLGDGAGGFKRLSTNTSVGGRSARLLGITQTPGAPGLMLVDRGGMSSWSLEMGWVGSYQGHGDGTVELLSRQALQALVGEGALVDQDQDGLTDVVLPLTALTGGAPIDDRQRVKPEYAQNTENSVAILRGLQDGGLAPWLRYWLDSPASAAGAADLNGDGTPDIVTAHDLRPSLTILLTKVTSCR